MNMKKQIVIFVPLIVLAIIFGVFLFSYRPQGNTVDPKIEEKRERTDRVTQTVTETSEPRKDPEDTTPAEIPEQVEREIIEQPQALHALEPVKEIEKNPPAPEEPADPVAAAWACLEYITQNPQQWGELSPEAAELMEQLTPLWRTKIGHATEEAIVLLEELGKLRDPRSAEIFVNYLNEGGIWVRYVEAALIAIGPPSVPLLVPLLDENGSFSNSFKRKRAVKLLGIIGSEYQEELGGAVEYIFLPKLEELTMLNPDYYGVREVASEAIFRLSSHEQDNTVASQIEGKQEGTDRVTATAAETSEQSQIPHAPEPVEKDEENPPAPEEPADPVAAAWAHLEYITQNPQQWGELSPEATELMAQLTPTWVMRSEGEGERAIELLNQLTKLRDPRSAEIFVNYLRAGVSGRPMEAALIEIGPPSVPPLISLLEVNTGFFLHRLIGAELLGIIGSEHHQELDGAVEYIILPKLEQLVISDPDYGVRDGASEAISRFGYLPQDSTVETPEQAEREINELIEQSQVFHTPEPVAKDQKNPPTPEEPADLVAAAWTRLEYISQNPQQWGELSPEATELIAQLTPTRTISTEEEMEEVIVLLEKLGELQDPRSAEIFVNYFGGGLWGKPMKEALIAIGPPSVPLLIPLLEADTRLLGRLIAAKLLGIIGSEHHHELGGVVEHIILPKLKKLVTSDPNPRVRRYASVAIARISYGQQDNTVETPEQVEREINETIRTAPSPSCTGTGERN
jgi:HEAT repeat protein